MFIEHNITGERRGFIEVICGSMFSGKTEELIRRLKRAQYAYQKVMVFKPSKDIRYDENNVVSHDSNMIRSTPVKLSKDILNQSEEYNVIGIDEAQFFDEELINVCQTLAFQGKRVIIAGLDLDFAGIPFGPMPSLLAVAEYITKVHAICVHCGNLATHSYRLTEDSEQVLLGAKDIYEPRCRVCYQEGNLINFNRPN